MRVSLGLAFAALFLLSACGTQPIDRAGSGAVIGAAGGALAGAAFGAPLAGALVGAAVGGAAGGFTSPSQVDLGKPVWR